MLLEYSLLLIHSLFALHLPDKKTSELAMTEPILLLHVAHTHSPRAPLPASLRFSLYVCT